MLWRIVRIDGQGNIKLILSEQINQISYLEKYDNPVYVGYRYTMGELHGTSLDSKIKSVVDTWYEENILGYESAIALDAIYCSDRTGYSDSGNTEPLDPSSFNGSTMYISYSGKYRIHNNKSSSFKCANEFDRLTWKNSSEGNPVLKNPIGLITADEVSYAGGVFSRENNSYYLSMDKAYWTMTPYDFNGSTADLFYVGTAGNLAYTYTLDNSPGVVPTLSLKSTTILAAGDGSSETPYTIE